MAPVAVDGDFYLTPKFPDENPLTTVDGPQVTILQDGAHLTLLPSLNLTRIESGIESARPSGTDLADHNLIDPEISSSQE